MFRKRKSSPPVAVAPRAQPTSQLSAVCDDTAIRLVRADHPYTSHTGDKMSFDGYELFDDQGQFRDASDVDRFIKVREGVWVARLAGIKYSLTPAHFAAMVPLARLRLVAEQMNPYDANAVAVCTEDGVRAGHLPASLAAEICHDVAGEKGSAALVLGVYRLDGRPVGVRLLVLTRSIALMVHEDD